MKAKKERRVEWPWGPFMLAIALAILYAPVVRSQEGVNPFRGLDPAKSLTQYTFENWVAENGLPQNSVNSIVQTPDGYLWLSTQEGLVRFDGVQFKTFDKRTTRAFPINFVTSMVVEDDGTMWMVLAGAGLMRKQGEVFTLFDAKAGLPESDVRTIFLAKNKTLWIGFRERGVAAYRNGTIRTYDAAAGVPPGEIRTIGEDNRGGIFVATATSIVHMHGDRFVPYTDIKNLTSFNAMRVDSEGALWFGANDGAYRKKGSTILHLTTKDGLPANRVNELYVDRQGLVWIGTEMGLSRWADGMVASFTERDGLLGGWVTSIYEDAEGNLWFGSDGGGLNVFKDGAFTCFTKKEGLIDDVVWSIFEDRSRAVWIGANAGLTKLVRTDSRWKTFTYSTAQGLARNTIWTIGETFRGAILVGSSGGIDEFDQGKFKHFWHGDKQPATTVQTLYRDHQGRMWAGTSTKGVFLVGDRRVTPYAENNSILDNNVLCITESPDGTMWFGTEGHGVFAAHDSVVVSYSPPNRFPNVSVNDIHIDSDSTVWVGTLGSGIVRIKNGAVSIVSAENGLFDDVVFRILDDGLGRYWMTCNKGIFFVSKDELNACADRITDKVVSTAYGKEDGLKSSECNGGAQPAGWRTKDGRLWFPTAKGVAVIDPRTIRINRNPPSVVIEELLVDGGPIDIQKQIKLPPGKHRMEFRYTGISFLAPKKVRFRYMLDGYDGAWVNAGTQRVAQYTNVPPGEYHFRVIAANSDGVWNETGQSLAFIQAAHFYQTRWFMVAAAFGVGALVLGIYWWRVRLIKIRQHELEILVDERTRDLVEEKARTEQALVEVERQRQTAEEANRTKSLLLHIASHDLKNPLVAVRSFAEMMRSESHLSERSQEKLDIIHAASQRMIGLINDLLSESAIETGKLPLNKKQIRLSSVAYIVVRNNKEQLSHNHQTATIDVPKEAEQFAFADPSLIQEVIENLLTNAMKFSQSGTVINIRIVNGDGTVRCEVRDQGPGLTSDDLAGLFKKYQRLSARPTKGEGSTGIGLSIAKQLVERHDGKIWAENIPGSGALFAFELATADGMSEQQNGFDYP